MGKNGWITSNPYKSDAPYLEEIPYEDYVKDKARKFG